MNGEVIDISERQPHEVAELICIKCLHRYIGVYPQATLLKDLECENCGKGFIIKTGQTIEGGEK